MGTVSTLIKEKTIGKAETMLIDTRPSAILAGVAGKYYVAAVEHKSLRLHQF